MLTDEDIKGGYPEEKEQTAYFQLFVLIALLITLVAIFVKFVVDLASNLAPYLK